MQLVNYKKSSSDEELAESDKPLRLRRQRKTEKKVLYPSIADTESGAVEAEVVFITSNRSRVHEGACGQTQRDLQSTRAHLCITGS